MRSLRQQGALVAGSAPPVRAVRETVVPAVAYWTLLVHAVLVTMLTAACLGFVVRPFAPGALVTPLSVTLLALSGWMIVSWRLAEGGVFNLYGLFMLAAMPFHVGFAVLHLVGREELMYLAFEIAPRQMAQTLWLVILGFAFMHLGALIRSAFSPSRAREALAAEHERPTVDLYLLGGLLLAASSVPTFLELRGMASVVSMGGYGELFVGGDGGASASGTVFGLLTAFFLPGVMCLLAGSRDRWIGQLVAAVAVAAYALAYLYLGYRAYAMLPVLAFVWLWHRCIRPLPLTPLALLGGALFFVVAPMVRYARGLTGGDRMSLPTLIETYTSIDNPVLGLIGEMGGSMLTISYTLELVPEVRPHEMGLGYLRAFFNAVPIMDVPTTYTLNTGSWLAWAVKPEWAAGGFGFGYSFIAEAYLNFGWIGAPLALAVLGFLTVAFQRWADAGGDPARLAVVAAFLPTFCFFVRGESINLARPLLWYALTPFVAVVILREVRRRLAARPAETIPPDAPIRRAS